MNRSPIFIHSLFRSGSTYLFKVFRRSVTGYTCYQEPLHEIPVSARDNPERLFVNSGKDLAHSLRHPALEAHYFQELYDAWPAWKDTLQPSLVYETYFASPGAEIGVTFWQSLINTSKARPVFQECKTSGRIGAIKNSLAGYHIYLWRNPWDQWWSYKATPHFDAANQSIMHAPRSPAAVELLRTSLGLESHGTRPLAQALAYYAERPLASNVSYLVFYMLWCLGLREGMIHGDLLLNIDRLSDSPVYRDEILSHLADAGIGELDFSDCRIPQGLYLEQDRAFFKPLENEVHQYLRKAGWNLDEIEQIQNLRQRYQPPNRNTEPTGVESMAEQTSRARSIARRLENRVAEISRVTAQRISELESRAAQAEIETAQAKTETEQAQARAERAGNRANILEQKVTDAEHRLRQQQARIAELDNHVHHLQHHADARENQMQAILASTSWRITSPLRRTGPVVRSLGSNAIKPPVKVLLRYAALYLDRRPRLKRLALSVSERFPSLATRLQPVRPEEPTEREFTREVPVELTRLGTRAHQIYSAIERHRKRSG